VVTGDIPHGEPEQIVLDDEFSLGGERFRIVVGNHQLLGLVVNEGGLTAVVELEFHSAGRGSIVVEESIANQGSKVQDVRFSLRVSALIHAASSRVLGERRMGSQASRAVDGIGRRNGVGVAIGRDAKHDLACRETGISPSLNGIGRRASLDGRTRVIQRSVGTDPRVGSPLTVNIVVHYGDVIKNFSEFRHVGHGLTIRTSEWRGRNGGSEVEIFCGRLRAQFLEEPKEILRIGARNLVTADARLVWIFPIEVNPVKLVFGGHIKDGLDERGTVLRSDRRREKARTSPSTDGDASHRPMFLSLADKVWNVTGSRVVKTED